MNSSEYKVYHESFMQNNHGSTALHTFFCVFFTLQCTLFCAIQQRREATNYLKEYFIIVLTMIMAHTFLSDYIYHLNIGAFLMLLKETIKRYDYLHIVSKMSGRNIYDNDRIKSISCLRGLTYLITGFCILAVDFVDFPRHLAKTEKYGFSLMDTGVGLFVLISGLVHKNVNKKNYVAVLKGNSKFILTLLCLGVLRYFTVKQLDYHEHISEYGVHWNFFFTLAVCKLLSSILLVLTNKALLLSILAIVFHEFLLYKGLQAWVFSDQPRISLIDANREGITSNLGYVALYLFAAYLRQLLVNNTILRYCILKKLVILDSILFIISYIINIYRPASRTLANAGYCSYLCTVLVTGILFMYLIEIIFLKRERTITYSVPFILDVINKNGLLYFLICNVCTGNINLYFKTLLLPPLATFMILNCYMIFTTCITIFVDKTLHKPNKKQKRV